MPSSSVLLCGSAVSSGVLRRPPASLSPQGGGRVWLLLCGLTTQRSGVSTSADAASSEPTPIMKKKNRSQMHFGIDPLRLDLQLRLHETDFATVASATEKAVQEERARIGKALNMSAVVPPEVVQSSLLEDAKHPAPSSSSLGPDAHGRGFGSSPHPGGRTIRGVVGAGATHDSSDPSVAFAQRRVENNPSLRYSLMDALNDCRLTNNWAKAYGLFTSAVQKALDTLPAVVPGSSGTVGTRGLEQTLGLNASGKETSSSKGGTLLSAAASSPAASENAEAYQVLYHIFATTPPPPSSTSAEGKGFSTSSSQILTGILRWRGFHHLSLLRLLIQCHRWKEVGEVWEVLHKTGFLEFQMDHKFANSLISTLRRERSVAATRPAVSSSESPSEGENALLNLTDSGSLPTSPGVEDEEVGSNDTEWHSTASHPEQASSDFLTSELEAKAKATARRMVLDVETIVKAKQLRLNKNNLVTVQKARIAQAIRETQEKSLVDIITEEEEAHTGEEWDGGAKTSPVEAGDFHGLLRQSTSHAATQHILSVMDSLGLPRDGTTYAAILASLQNPMYLVENATLDEVEPNYATSTASSRSARESKSGGQKALPVNRPASPEALQAGKERYEAYRRRRANAAAAWFDQCAVKDRNAILFNEYLYLLRGKEQAAEFDRVLTLFRGNPLFSPSSSLTTTSSSLALLLPSQWQTPPDGKTYELLLLRLRYQHEWEAMWAVLEEMQSEKVRGTTRTYRMLLAEAKLHPPQALEGDRDGIARLTIRLFTDMRNDQRDIKSLDDHVGVINAWSITQRSKRV